MLNENKLDNVKERIDVMIKAMTHIDESKLSNASILMLINALDAISSLSSDLLRSYVWYIKKYGSGNLNKLETNAVLFQEMADGQEKLLDFVNRLAKEVEIRDLLLK